jgi:ABC-2 type transport system ATP-binding protein
VDTDGKSRLTDAYVKEDRGVGCRVSGCQTCPVRWPASIVTLDRVGKRYGSRAVLSDVDLAVAPGQVVVVRGENGAGKTTLLRLIAGASTPSRGRVVRNGVAAFVPERFPAELALGAREYLRHMARIAGASQARVDELVEGLGLTANAGKEISELSKGTAQKVALAQALIREPDLLVLDEPWSGLDTGARARLTAAITNIRARGAAVVMSDHRTEVTPDRALLVLGGRVSETSESPSDALFEIELTGRDPELVRTLPGAREVDGWRLTVRESDRDALIAAALERGLSIEGLRRR